MNDACRSCGGAAELVSERAPVVIGHHQVTVEHEFYRCTRCGESLYRAGQMAEAQRRAAAVLREEAGLLQPAEIKAFREQWGFTQSELERLLNTGPKTVVRWERGTVAQGAAVDTFLRLLRENPGSVRVLARMRGVKLKLSPQARATLAEVPSVVTLNLPIGGSKYPPLDELFRHRQLTFRAAIVEIDEQAPPAVPTRPERAT